MRCRAVWWEHLVIGTFFVEHSIKHKVVINHSLLHIDRLFGLVDANSVWVHGSDHIVTARRLLRLIQRPFANHHLSVPLSALVLNTSSANGLTLANANELTCSRAFWLGFV